VNISKRTTSCKMKMSVIRGRKKSVEGDIPFDRRRKRTQLKGGNIESARMSAKRGAGVSEDKKKNITSPLRG